MQPVGEEREREREKKKEKRTNDIVFILERARIVGQIYIGFLPSFSKESFMPGLPPPRGGVTGRLFPKEGVLAFFSDGFKI